MRKFAGMQVKILGTAIGDVGDEAEFDGDGDGFRRGRNGKDNVPVAASAVVAAVKKAGKVSDLVKPTDDLMEARKSGRPWAPLMIEHQPKEWLDDFKKLADDVAKETIGRVKKGIEIRAEWEKKYGWNGSFDFESFKVIPKDVYDQNRKYVVDAGLNLEFDGGFYERIADLDARALKHLESKLQESRDKANAEGRAGKFDKDFASFVKNLKGQEIDFKPAMTFMKGVGNFSFFVGKLGDDYKLVDQFALAEKAAKDAVANPNKRIVVQIHNDIFEQMLTDGKIKNFFQSKRNVFNDEFGEIAAYDKWQAANRKRQYLKYRLQGEQNLMGLPAGGFEGKNRPIYGMYMANGVAGMSQENLNIYGGVGVVLKHSVEERSTFTIGDSLGDGSHGVTPINNPGMGIGMMNRGGFVIDTDPSERFKEEQYSYSEAQIMGGVSVSDISYITVKDDSVLSDEIKTRLKEMGIPVVIHDSKGTYKEPPELSSKAATKADSYVLLATSGDRKLFAPNLKPKEGDLHGMMTVGNGKRQRVENISAIMKFGNWEFV